MQELEVCRTECSSLLRQCAAWDDDCRRLREEHTREAATLAARAEAEAAGLRQQHAEQLDAALATAAVERSRAEALLRDEMCKTLQVSIRGKHGSAQAVCTQRAQLDACIGPPAKLPLGTWRQVSVVACVCVCAGTGAAAQHGGDRLAGPARGCAE